MSEAIDRRARVAGYAAVAIYGDCLCYGGKWLGNRRIFQIRNVVERCLEAEAAAAHAEGRAEVLRELESEAGRLESRFADNFLAMLKKHAEREESGE